MVESVNLPLADVPLLDEAAELLGEDDTADRVAAARAAQERKAEVRGQPELRDAGIVDEPGFADGKARRALLRAVAVSLAIGFALIAEAQGLPEHDIPEYVAPDGTDKATFVRVPTLDEVPYPVKMEPNLVVEFYSR